GRCPVRQAGKEEQEEEQGRSAPGRADHPGCRPHPAGGPGKTAADGRPCTDEEFLRRAYLDITGVIPTVEKARTFLDDKSPDKRAKLLDELLADPNYGRRMADIWTAKLFPRDSANRFVVREPFYKWFEDE